MSREIRFRAWDKYHKCFLTLSGNGYMNPMELMYSCVSETEKYVFMQYTGLKDKNGTEIYEGDVLQAVHVARPQTVVYDSQDCAFRTKTMYLNNTMEVMGNIYESPELLEDKE